MPGFLLAAALLAGPAATGQTITITNPGFETDAFTVYPGYVSGNKAITGWPGGPPYHVGLNPANGSPFADNGAIPEGTKVAFIQNNPGGVSTLSNTITGLIPGTRYNVAFRINARGGNLPWLRFSADGTGEPVTMEVTSVGGANPYKHAACEFTATEASQAIHVTNVRADGDHTVVLDDFSIDESTGAWAFAPWTGDADSGIDPQYLYTHAYSLGASPPLEINGVRFVPWENGVVGRFTLSGLPYWYANGPNNLTGESYNLAKDFRYGDVTGITLYNLKPSTQYVFTLYGFGWDSPASGTPYRSSTFESSLGGDRFTVNLNHYGQGNGMRVTYAYTTDAFASPVTISYPSHGSGTFHTSGFTNREAAPSSPPTAWTTAPWYDDESSGVDGTFLYTHAYNFGSATSLNINGVDFTGIPGAYPADANLSTTLWNVYNNDLNNNITGAGAVMARDFLYRGDPEVITLTGLTPGKDYVFTAYSTGWEAAGARINAMFGNPGDGPVWLDQDEFGADNGIRFEYRYTADDTGSVTVMISMSAESNAVHVCGISNREADPLVATAPVITLQPVGATLGAGADHLLRVGATGSPDLAYQWQLDGEDLDGETGPVLDLPAIDYAQSGDYTVTVTNNYGSQTSEVATIAVYDNLPWLSNTGVGFDGEPLPAGAIDPHFTLAVNPHAPGSTEVRVQSGLPGAWLPNSATSQWIGPLQDTAAADGATDAGEGPGVYVYRTKVDLTGFNVNTVVISGSWATDNAGLGIRVNGVDTGIVHNAGDTFTYLEPFAIDITNAPGLVAGVNTLDFVVQNASLGYTGLRIEGLVAAGEIPPGTAPRIAVQPQDVAAPHNASVQLGVAASGSATLEYQWYRNGTLLDGEVEPFLTLYADSPEVAGDYTVTVTNGSGSVESDVAVVSVPNAAPVPNYDEFSTGRNVPLQIIDYDLLWNDTDADGDPLEVTGVSATSIQGGTVVLEFGQITYTPPPGFTGFDGFTYTVSDGIWGGTSEGDIYVDVKQMTDPAPAGLEIVLAGGTATASFTGAPGTSYTLERSTTLAAASWTTIDTVVAPESGLVQIDDPAPPLPRAFYRIAYAP